MDLETISLDWQQSLAAPDRDSARQTFFGPEGAEDMPIAWEAHDVKHILQHVELHYTYLVRQA